MARMKQDEIMENVENIEATEQTKERSTKIRVRIHFTEECLGMMASSKKIHEEYIASKAPDAPSREEEVAAIGVEEVIENGKTVFPREIKYVYKDGCADLSFETDPNGRKCYWDYQIRGFFKESCSMLKRVPGSKCSAVKAFKKEIDGCLFVYPDSCDKYTILPNGVRKKNRQIPIIEPENAEQYDPTFTGDCQRPLRAQTAQGDRVTLANSETIPAGSTITFVVDCQASGMKGWVRECLDFGEEHGFGQWRNSGKGAFLWEELDADGNQIGGNW